MRVRLKANGASRTAEIAYYAYEDATFLTEWQGAVGEDRNPLRRDAVGSRRTPGAGGKRIRIGTIMRPALTIWRFTLTTSRGLGGIPGTHNLIRFFLRLLRVLRGIPPGISKLD